MKALRLSAVLGAGVATASFLLHLRRDLAVITVRGLSMSPTLEPGDRLLVSRRDPHTASPGQVVILERPSQSPTQRQPPRRFTDRDWYVKRVVAVAGDPVPTLVRERRGLPADAVVGPGELVVLGEHPHSEDSKQWGTVPVERVLGVVVRKL